MCYVEKQGNSMYILSDFINFLSNFGILSWWPTTVYVCNSSLTTWSYQCLLFPPNLCMFTSSLWNQEVLHLGQEVKNLRKENIFFETMFNAFAAQQQSRIKTGFLQVHSCIIAYYRTWSDSGRSLGELKSHIRVWAVFLRELNGRMSFLQNITL